MSYWSKIIDGFRKSDEKIDSVESHCGSAEVQSAASESVRIAYVDVEVGANDRKIHDIGALRDDDSTFHQSGKKGLMEFLDGIDYLCGHNIVKHDARYIFGNDGECLWILVDTLYMSPILFPERSYHRLVKDYKLVSEQMNNPVADCRLTRELL